MEDKTRVLAEEVALLRKEVESQKASAPRAPERTDTEELAAG